MSVLVSQNAFEDMILSMPQTHLVLPSRGQKCLVSEFECKIEDGVWLVLQHIFIDSSHNTDWIIMQTECYYVKKTKLTDSLVAGKKAKIIKKCWVLNIG